MPYIAALMLVVLSLVLPIPGAAARAPEDCKSAKTPEARIKACTQVLRQNRKTDWALLQRALAFAEIEDYPNVISDTSTLINLAPRDALTLSATRMLRAAAYIAEDRTDEAKADASAAIALAPQNPKLIEAYGFYSAAIGEVDNAFRAADLLLRLDRRSAAAHAMRAVAYMAKKDPAAAMEAANRSLELDPKQALAIGNRGILHRDLGKLDQSIMDFDFALKAQPDHTDWLSERALSFLQKGDFKNARADLDRAIIRRPKLVVLWTNRGIAHWRSGDFEAAQSDLNHALKLDPKNVHALTNRARFFAERKAVGVAIADYGRLIALEPANGDHYNGRGLVHRSNKSPDLARKDFELSIRLSPRSSHSHNNLGLLEADRKAWREAIAHYIAALAIDPADKNALENRAWAYARSGKHNEAISDYSRLVEAGDADAGVYNDRGDSYAAVKRLDLALVDHAKAVELAPKNASYIGRYGSLLDDAGQYGRAIAMYDRAIAIDPDSALHWNNRGVTYRKLQRYNQALLDFDKALAVDPGYTLSRRNKAQVLMHLDRLAEAEVEANRAVEAEPRNARMHIVLGDIHFRSNNFQSAIESFSRAAELDNEWLWPRNRRGRTLAASGDMKTGLAEITTLIETKPSGSLLSALGWLLQLSGDMSGAVDAYTKAIAIDPDDHWAKASRGHAHYFHGRYGEAAVDFRAASALRRDYTYHFIFAFLAMTALADDADAKSELRAQLKSATALWPSPVAAFLLGDIGEDQLMAAAETNERRCEAYYFAGEVHAKRGRNHDAIERMLRAVELCPRDFIEWPGALIALSRLLPMP